MSVSVLRSFNIFLSSFLIFGSGGGEKSPSFPPSGSATQPSVTYGDKKSPNTCPQRRGRLLPCNFESQCYKGYICCPFKKICLKSSTSPIISFLQPDWSKIAGNYLVYQMDPDFKKTRPQIGGGLAAAMGPPPKGDTCSKDINAKAGGPPADAGSKYYSLTFTTPGGSHLNLPAGIKLPAGVTLPTSDSSSTMYHCKTTYFYAVAMNLWTHCDSTWAGEQAQCDTAIFSLAIRIMCDHGKIIHFGSTNTCLVLFMCVPRYCCYVRSCAGFGVEQILIISRSDNQIGACTFKSNGPTYKVFYRALQSEFLGSAQYDNSVEADRSKMRDNYVQAMFHSLPFFYQGAKKHIKVRVIDQAYALPVETKKFITDADCKDAKSAYAQSLNVGGGGTFRIPKAGSGTDKYLAAKQGVSKESLTEAQRKMVD